MPYYTALPSPSDTSAKSLFPKSPYSSASLSRPLPTLLSPLARLRDQALRIRSLITHAADVCTFLGDDPLKDRRPLAGLDEPSFKLVLGESSPGSDDVRGSLFGVHRLLVRTASDPDVPDSVPEYDSPLPMDPLRLIGPEAMPRDCLIRHVPTHSGAWLDSLFQDTDPEPSVTAPDTWTELADLCFPGHPLSSEPSRFLPSGLDGPPYSSLPEEPPTGWAARRLPLVDLVSPFHAFSEFLASGPFIVSAADSSPTVHASEGSLVSLSVHRPTLDGPRQSDKSGDELLADLGLVPSASCVLASSASVCHGNFANLSRCPKAASLVLRGHVPFTVTAVETEYKDGDEESALTKVRRVFDEVYGRLAVEFTPDFSAGPDDEGRLKWTLSGTADELRDRAVELAAPLLRASSVPLDGSVPAPVKLSPDDGDWEEGTAPWTSWEQPALDGSVYVAADLCHAHVFVPGGFLADLESDPDKPAGKES